MKRRRTSGQLDPKCVSFFASNQILMINPKAFPTGKMRFGLSGFGTGGRTRTDTSRGHLILSQARLPFHHTGLLPDYITGQPGFQALKLKQRNTARETLDLLLSPLPVLFLAPWPQG